MRTQAAEKEEALATTALLRARVAGLEDRVRDLEVEKERERVHRDEAIQAVCVCVCVCTHTHTHTHTHTCMHAHTCTHMHTHTYIDTYILHVGPAGGDKVSEWEQDKKIKK